VLKCAALEDERISVAREGGNRYCPQFSGTTTIIDKVKDRKTKQ